MLLKIEQAGGVRQTGARCVRALGVLDQSSLRACLVCARYLRSNRPGATMARLPQSRARGMHGEETDL